MDSHPFRSFSNSVLIKRLSAFVFAALSVFVFSCANTEPQIVSPEVKLVYNFEDENKTAQQKLNVFLKMKSDVRRVETIKIKHNGTGYRWVITNPLISQSEGYYFAGYTNLEGVSAEEGIPEGSYTITYMDAAGREDFSEFELEKDLELKGLKVKDFLKVLKFKEPEIFVGIYSEQNNLLYYGNAKADWKITKEYSGIAADKIFLYKKDATSFRVFYKLKNQVFIMPRVLKNEENSPTEEQYAEQELKRQMDGDR